jgi:radical SAM superfamily enzyme YgiQ (UPF0313 family)
MSNIGLIDVDGHNFPNLCLMKISHYHKRIGDSVNWYSPFEHYDMVYMSKVFTFTEDYQYLISNANKVIKGGSGYNHNMDLFCENEQLDLELYKGASFYTPNTSYGFLTRGCPNKCAWCIVPKKEGTYYIANDIEYISQGCKNVVLMDNNILGNKEFAKEQLNKIIKLGIRVDFNQGLDARLLCKDEEFIALMSKIKWIKYIRLACDQHSQIESIKKCVELFGQNGIKPSRFFVYAIIKDLDETYNRINELKDIGVSPFGQPYRDFTQRQIIPQWQNDMARWVNIKSAFKSCDFKEFSPRKGFVCNKYFNQ